MNNMDLYNKVRTVPQEALKQIGAGRLKGKSDINPMWRLKMLTEHFGMCGIGWKYTIAKQWIEKGSGEEQAAFVNIELFVKVDGQWSDPIPGTGGSSFVAQEKSGPYTSDECYKMALTDAISVACKALGFGADVYWSADNTKCDQRGKQQDNTYGSLISKDQVVVLRDLLGMGKEYTESVFCSQAKIASIEQLPASRYDAAFRHVQQQIASELEKAA